MSGNKKGENHLFGSQTEEEDQKTGAISGPSNEGLDPSCSEDVGSQLAKSLKNLELPSSSVTVDDLQQYDMSHEKRGKAIIFNHNEFNPYLNLLTREGTKKDVERLEHVFNMHSFEVKVYNDLETSDIFTVIKRDIANADHSNADCVAVVILTHGKNSFLYAWNGAYTLSTLVEMIKPDKCLSLAGKPKLIFVQASNGDKVDHGWIFGFQPNHMSVKIPSYTDFLIAESRARGYVAMKHEEEGSLLVRAIEEVLSKEKSYTTSFLTLVREVIAREALKYQNPGDLKKVEPSITTTLTKELIFVKK